MSEDEFLPPERGKVRKGVATREGGRDAGHSTPILSFPLRGGREKQIVTPYLAVAFL